MFGELDGKQIADSQFNTFKQTLATYLPIPKETENIVNRQPTEFEKKFQKAQERFEKRSQNTSDANYAFGTAMDYKPEKFAFNTRNYNVGELYEELSDGSLYKKFDTYTPGINNYEDHAQKMTFGDKAWNGLAKFVDTVGTTVVGGTAGAVYGIGEAIAEGRFASLYDNDFTKELDLHGEKMKLDYAHYKTIDEQDDAFFEKLNNWNFWFDDLAQGFAFTTGALVTEGIWAWATGGTSLATVGTRWGMKGVNALGKLTKVVSTVGKVADKALDATRYLDDMTRVANAGRKAVVAPQIMASTKVLSKLNDVAFKTGIWGGRIGEGANVLRGMITSAGYEAGFEARAFMNESRKDYMTTFESQNGRKPTKDEIAEFETSLDNSANGLYAYNLAIVGMGNVAQFGNIMKIRLPKMPFADTLNKKIFGVGLETVEGVGVKALKATKLQKIGQYGYSLGRDSVWEGAFEEGLQSVGTHTFDTLMKSSYDKNLAKENYSFVKAFGESLGKTYGTKEGLNEVFTGMVVGALTGNVMGMVQTAKAGSFTVNHEFANANKRNKQIEETFSGDSRYSSKNAIENMVMANRVLQSKKAEENADKKGDFLGGELARSTSLFANFSKANNLDYLDDHIEQLSSQVDLLSEKDLAEKQGITVSQARELKDSMKEELVDQAKSFKRINEFSKYMIGNKISSAELEVAVKKAQEVNPGIDEKLVKNQIVGQLREALTYELYMGEASYKHGENMLGAFQNEVENLFGDSEVKGALNIVDVLNKSSNVTQRELFKAKIDLKTTKEELTKLDKEQRVLETVVANARTPEARQEAVSKLNGLVTRREDLANKEQELTDNWNILFDSAKIENPYNKSKKQILSSDEILNAEKTVNTTLGSIDQLPQDKAIRLKTLLREYEKSISATKKYSDRTNQMMGLGGNLRADKGIIGKILASKTPRQSTIEMIQGLLDTHYEQTEVENDAFENSIQEVKLKQPVSEGVSIKPKEELKKLNLVDYIKEQIKNNPYIFENVGEDFSQSLPKEGELDEYLAFYEKNELEEIPLTEEEKQRYNELNDKFANWQLMEAMEFEGVSLADLIKQQASLNQAPAIVEDTTLVEDDLETMEESVNEEINKERRFEVLQTPQNVFVQKEDDKVLLSHLTAKSLLEMLSVKDFEVFRGNKQVYKTKDKPLTLDDLEEVLEAEDVISFGNTAIRYAKGARLVVYEDDFKSLDLLVRATKSGYSLVFGIDGKAMKSDFADIDRYSAHEISKLKKGDELTMVVESEEGSFNSKLVGKSEQEVIDNLKISFEDNGGNRVADLKANYQTKDGVVDEKFLEIRKKAYEIWKNSTEDKVIVGYVPVSTVFLGAPGVEIDPLTKQIKEREIVPELVQDYGYWDGQKLVLKGGTKARIDFLKGVKKQLPIVVLKEGNNLIAYPVSLNTVDTGLGQKIIDENLPKAQLATELNKQLKANGIDSNLFFISSDNTNMLEADGKTSQELETAIEALNKVQDKPDYTKTWFESEHSKDKLKEEASINVAMNSGQMFLSPKIVVSLNDWTEVANTTERLSEKAVELIDLKNQSLTLGKGYNALRISDNTFKRNGATFRYVRDNDGKIYYTSANNKTFEKLVEQYEIYPKDAREEILEKIKAIAGTNKEQNILDKFFTINARIAELESDPLIKDEYDSWANMSEEKQQEAYENSKC
jgi:hypothetical protein